MIVMLMYLLRYISYLPLAHIYERANQIALLHYGVAIGFYQGVCSFETIWDESL
jgi:long-subunit acyl-CoA synthetase (AMP-forming)